MSGSPQLRHADLQVALDCAGEIAGCGDAGEFDLAMIELSKRIGADAAMVTACRGWAEDLVLESGDHSVYPPALLAEVARSGGDHPVMADDFFRLSQGARRLSDFVRSREWSRADLFNGFYQPLGMTYELSTQLSWGPTGSSRCLALHRSGGDFSERDRALLGLLAPHLRAARDRIEVAALARRRLRMLSEDAGGNGQGTLVLGEGGELVASSPQARELIADWFGCDPESVPAELVVWRSRRRSGHAPAVFQLRRGERRLEARLVPAEGEAGEELILLTESGRELSPALLSRALPITLREGEVLARLAAGDTNDGIAHALGISRNTVVRHVEHLYAKLDVHTRAAATRRALDSLA